MVDGFTKLGDEEGCEEIDKVGENILQAREINLLRAGQG